MVLGLLTGVAVHAVTQSALAEPKQTEPVSEAFGLRFAARYDEAKEVLDAELAKNPANARAWFELARLRFQAAGKTREIDSAQEAIEKAVKADPDSGLYHCWAARIAIYSGILKAHARDHQGIANQFKKAAESGERAVELEPGNHAARTILVSLYGNNPPDLVGDKKLAEEHLGIMAERSPVAAAEARCGYSLQRDSEKRLALWQELAKTHNADPRVHANLANEYARAGDIDKATQQADKALQLDPGNGAVLMDICRTFGLKKKHGPAKRFAKRYLACDPPGPVALRAWTTFALAQIERRSGDQEKADKTLAEAKRLDPYLWTTMTPPPKELFEPPAVD